MSVSNVIDGASSGSGGSLPDGNIHDLIIVGAGPAGLALALALGPGGLGLDVVVVAQSQPARRPANTPGRAYALGAGSCAMLKRLGVWEEIAPLAQAMQRIVVTDGKVGGSQLSLLEFGAEDTAEGPALIVEEPALMSALVTATDQQNTRFEIGSVSGTELAARSSTVCLEAGKDLQGRLIVAADGAGSALRSLNKIKMVDWDYGQAGLVATIDHDAPHNGVAIERFYPTGPFAMLPLCGNRTSLVWTDHLAATQGLLDLDETEFEEELQDRFGDDRGEITGIGPRLAFPLKFQIAHSFIADRLALIGDAAHIVHPLAGQGLNLGYRDVAALAESVADAARLGLDIGDQTTLRRYERWRRFDTVQLALGFDGLNGLFSNDNTALRLIRDLGLGMVERLPPVKRFFMAEAAGVSGQTPRLLAGNAL